jgi:hypothetical protein
MTEQRGERESDSGRARMLASTITSNARMAESAASSQSATASRARARACAAPELPVGDEQAKRAASVVHELAAVRVQADLEPAAAAHTDRQHAVRARWRAVRARARRRGVGSSSATGRRHQSIMQCARARRTLRSASRKAARTAQPTARSRAAGAAGAVCVRACAYLALEPMRVMRPVWSYTTACMSFLLLCGGATICTCAPLTKPLRCDMLW